MKKNKERNEKQEKTFEQRIKENIGIWFLGVLLTGFLSGIGTYQAILKINNRVTISNERLKTLEQVSSNYSGSTIVQLPLPSYLDKQERDDLIQKVRSAFNDSDAQKLNLMFGPITRATLNEKLATLQVESLFKSLGKINNDYYVQYKFVGQQGSYKYFTLHYFAEYENAERGYVTIQVIDDGTSHQISSMMFGKL